MINRCKTTKIAVFGRFVVVIISWLGIIDEARTTLRVRLKVFGMLTQPQRIAELERTFEGM